MLAGACAFVFRGICCVVTICLSWRTFPKQAVETNLTGTTYQHGKVGQWTNNIIEQTLKKLTQLNKPFKYIGMRVALW